MPTSHIETSQRFEWDVPWSFGFLFACILVIGAWSFYQIIREGKVAQSRWGILFVLLRTIVAAVLLWMILGPNSVLVRKETHRKTMAVYVDTSSSMQIQDQPDEVPTGVGTRPQRKWPIRSLPPIMRRYSPRRCGKRSHASAI